MIDSASASLVVSAAGVAAVFYYARVQTRLQKEAAEARQLERMEAEAHEVDGAKAILDAERLRIRSIATRWQAADLVKLSLDGELHPDQLEPTNWALLMTAIARVGFMTATLADFAVAELRDCAFVATRLIALARQDPMGKNTLDTADRLKRTAQQVVLILEDALAYGPPSAVGRTVDLRFPMKSDAGKRLVVDLQARVEALKERQPNA